MAETKPPAVRLNGTSGEGPSAGWAWTAGLCIFPNPSDAHVIANLGPPLLMIAYSLFFKAFVKKPQQRWFVDLEGLFRRHFRTYI